MAQIYMTELKGHKNPILSVKCRGDRLISASEDRTARLWDVRTKKATRCLCCFDAPVSSACFNPKKEYCVYASSQKKIYTFDLRKSGILLAEADTTVDFNEDEINEIEVSRNGDYLAACDDSGDVKIVDLNSNRLFKTLTNKHDNICYCIAFGRRSPWQLISGGMDCSLISWDFSRSKVQFSLSTPVSDSDSNQLVNPPYVYAMSVSDSGHHLSAALGNGQIAIYDLKRKIEAKRLNGHTASATCVSYFTSSNTRMVSAGNDKSIFVWDLERNLSLDGEEKDDEEAQSLSEWQSKEMILKIGHHPKPNYICADEQDCFYVADTSNVISRYRIQ